MNKLEQYEEYINNLPTPGGGEAHRVIYRAGCLGYEAGVPCEFVVSDITETLQDGTRHAPDSEIQQGVELAYLDRVEGEMQRAARVLVCGGKGVTYPS